MILISHPVDKGMVDVCAYIAVRVLWVVIFGPEWHGKPTKDTSSDSVDLRELFHVMDICTFDVNLSHE